MVKDMYTLWKEREGKEREEVIGLLHGQLKVEGELIRLYEETEAEIHSNAVKYMLHMIAMDSRKHIDICQTALEFLEGNDVLKSEKAEILKGL